MNLKHFIREINKRQQIIKKFISDLGENWGEERTVMKLFLGAPDYCLSHPRVVRLLADYLQTINDEVLLSEFELHDVERLYGLNMEELPNDISQYEDLANFYSLVLDDDIKARDIINKGTEKAFCATKEMEELRKNIEL
jgi:hypothetical protein